MRNYIMVRRNHYTEEELLKKLKDWAMNNNKNPTFHDIDTGKEIPIQDKKEKNRESQE